MTPGYQYGTGSGLYSSTTSVQREGTSLTGQYTQGGSNEVYRSGTYQSGTYQPSTTQGAYQATSLGGYQGIQGVQGVQSSFKSGTSQLGSSSYQFQSGTSQAGSSTQGSTFQSSYTYKKP